MNTELSPAHQIVFVCLWAVGLFLNLFCVIVVGSITYRKRSWPNILLFMLTLIDEAVVVLGLSPGVGAAVANNNLLWEAEGLCVYQSIIINTWDLYSYVIIVSISVDRYMAVCHPFTYNKRLNYGNSVAKGAAVLVSGGCLAVLISCLPLMLGATIRPVGPGLFCFFDWTATTTPNAIVAILNISFVSLALGVVLFCTLATCFEIYNIVRAAHNRNNMSAANRARVESNDVEVKFAKLTIVVVILFASFNLPFVVREPCSLLISLSCYVSILPLQVTVIVQMLTGRGSSDVGYLALSSILLATEINPIVHSFVQKSVRNTCKNIARAVCQWK